MNRYNLLCTGDIIKKGDQRLCLGKWISASFLAGRIFNSDFMQIIRRKIQTGENVKQVCCKEHYFKYSKAKNKVKCMICGKSYEAY